MTTSKKPHRRSTSNLGGFAAIRSAAHGLDFIDIGLNDDYRVADLPFQPRTVLDIGANCGLFFAVAAHHYQDAVMDIFQDTETLRRLD